MNNQNELLNEPVKKKPRKTTVVPFQKIVDLYHEKLPNHPKVLMLTTARKAQMKARWINHIKSLDEWAEYFERVSENPFLSGKKPAGYNRPRPFIANLDFLIKETNVMKIAEGFYEDE